MSHRIKFITIIGIFTLNCVFNAHANTANDIYRMAQQSPSRITTISDIDALDSSGNTALCNAILNDDVATYNTLVKYGADKKHECVKNISKKKYDKFIAKTTSASSKTFLGLGKWGWGGILGGVAVAGAAAAMGGGSGGGGGGDSAGSTGTGNNPPPSTPGNDDWTEYDAWVRAEFPFAENAPCPNGYTHSECRALSTGEYYCKCDNYVNCPSSYQIQCQNGFHETSNTCQSGPNILKECVADTCPSDYKTNCGNGYHAGQTCQSGDTTYMECVANTCDGFNYLETDTCPKGWLGGSACQSGDVTKYKCDLPDTCPHNYKTSCGAGYHATENTCQVTKYYTNVSKTRAPAIIKHLATLGIMLEILVNLATQHIWNVLRIHVTVLIMMHPVHVLLDGQSAHHAKLATQQNTNVTNPQLAPVIIRQVVILDFMNLLTNAPLAIEC